MYFSKIEAGSRIEAWASPINNCYPRVPAITTEFSTSPDLAATLVSIMCSSESATMLL